MGIKHSQLLLRTNTLGAAHNHLDMAASLLESLAHPEARRVRAAADNLLSVATDESLPLFERLNNLPDDADFPTAP